MMQDQQKSKKGLWGTLAGIALLAVGGVAGMNATAAPKAAAKSEAPAQKSVSAEIVAPPPAATTAPAQASAPALQKAPAAALQKKFETAKRAPTAAKHAQPATEEMTVVGSGGTAQIGYKDDAPPQQWDCPAGTNTSFNQGEVGRRNMLKNGCVPVK